MGLILFNFIYSAPVSVGTGTKALAALWLTLESLPIAASG